jgi:general stress protein YciG
MENLPVGKSHANPAFHEFAASLRDAADRLKTAAKIAGGALCFPQMDFARVRRHLESMAVFAEEEKLLLAYVKHNTLTDAPPHPRSLHRVRGRRRETSEAKKRAARENGRKGGRSDSKLKKDTARENGKKGGRPRRKPKPNVARIRSVDEGRLQVQNTPAPLAIETIQELPFAGL